MSDMSLNFKSVISCRLPDISKMPPNEFHEKFGKSIFNELITKFLMKLRSMDDSSGVTEFKLSINFEPDEESI